MVSSFCSLAVISGTEIDQVSLFKNGLCIVRAKVEIPKSGELVLDSFPAPVNGTYWVDSESELTSKVTHREAAVDFTTLRRGELLQSLRGQAVELKMKSGEVLSGTVLAPPKNLDETFAKNYASINTANHHRFGYWQPNNSAVGSGHLLLPLVYLQKEAGSKVAIDPAEVVMINFDGQPVMTRNEKVLVINSVNGKAANADVEFLTQGISWVPSYRIDLSDDAKLKIRQKAVLRNEAMDLSNTEIQLISGFPSVKFAAVDSPLGVNATWANFFNQMVSMENSTNRAGTSALYNSATQQIASVVGNNRNNNRPMVPNLEAGGKGSLDLHFQSLDRHDLSKGESLSINVANAQANYQRMVEWRIPDTRTVDGRRVQEYEIQRNPAKYDAVPWDVVVFANPFDFPMTTAASMIVKHGNFLGQQQTSWTNPGEEVTAKINKALSVATKHFEVEDQGQRKEKWIFGTRYYSTKVTGELEIINFRDTKVAMRILREFSGKMISADEKPGVSLLEKGVYSVNTRNQMIWNIEVKPGEKRTLKYNYEVFVRG